MALGVGTKTKAAKRNAASAWAWLALIVPSASCVPAGLTAAPDLSLGPVAPPAPAFAAPAEPVPAAAPTPGLAALFGNPAYAANAAIPVAGGLNPAAPAFVFRAGTALDSLRSLDCLAQAVYYEARSESEDGQRAVAQVVLNRVRHPAWPNSVCGVVYQGPMRAGGGCQFTFTCDGSLGRRPEGVNWARARAIAAEALAGRTYAGVGTSTHYHTSAVFPAWAPRLVKTAVIGAHNFYRLPGLGGAPGAFVAAYTGSEPLPRPAMTLVARRARHGRFRRAGRRHAGPGPRRRDHAVGHPPGRPLGRRQPARIDHPRGISPIRPVARRRPGRRSTSAWAPAVAR